MDGLSAQTLAAYRKGDFEREPVQASDVASATTGAAR
jgi:hypothetical protein